MHSLVRLRSLTIYCREGDGPSDIFSRSCEAWPNLVKCCVKYAECPEDALDTFAPFRAGISRHLTLIWICACRPTISIPCKTWSASGTISAPAGTTRRLDGDDHWQKAQRSGSVSTSRHLHVESMAGDPTQAPAAGPSHSGACQVRNMECQVRKMG
jgi:hypothetical protein